MEIVQCLHKLLCNVLHLTFRKAFVVLQYFEQFALKDGRNKRCVRRGSRCCLWLLRASAGAYIGRYQRLRTHLGIFCDHTELRPRLKAVQHHYDVLVLQLAQNLYLLS
eukprot:scaffold1446_cov391-Prasinococcus_capsulatus_cf.AAC.2